VPQETTAVQTDGPHLLVPLPRKAYWRWATRATCLVLSGSSL
jgi:hypothetical protein